MGESGGFVTVYVVLQGDDYEGYGEPISVHATQEGSHKKKLELEAKLPRCGSWIDVFLMEVEP